MKKQSSIEWLVEQLHNGKELSTVIRKAKEMHKQEIIEARDTAPNMITRYLGEAEDYYKNTYEKEN